MTLKGNSNFSALAFSWFWSKKKTQCTTNKCTTY